MPNDPMIDGGNERKQYSLVGAEHIDQSRFLRLTERFLVDSPDLDGILRLFFSNAYVHENFSKTPNVRANRPPRMSGQMHSRSPMA